MTDCVLGAPDEISPEAAQKRFVEARRNGRATWLWPDISVANWRASLDVIVSVAGTVLAGAPSDELTCSDAQAMGIAAYTSGMGPLLGYWIENGTIRASTEIADILRNHLWHNRRRMARLLAVARETVQKLCDADISPLILKGMHTAFCYFPEPGTRPLSDVDLFIPPEQIAKAEHVFAGLGYQRVPRTRSPYACDWIDPSVSMHPRTLAFVHENDPWSVDVLGSLDKHLTTGARIKFDSLLSHIGPANFPVGASIMRQPLLALYLAAHFSQTLLNATIVRAFELVQVFRRDCADGSLDWEEFVGGGVAIGGLRFVYPALVMVEQLARETIPRTVIDAATSDAPQTLRNAMARLTLATTQPLDRHSVSERFMWAAGWRETLVQAAGELSIDGRGKPVDAALYSIGTKLWALRRRRYTR